MNGLTVISQGNISVPVTLDWQIAGVGDINGDGTADIIWRNFTSGDVYGWLMNGLAVAGQGFISVPIPLHWPSGGGGERNGAAPAALIAHNFTSPQGDPSL